MSSISNSAKSKCCVHSCPLDAVCLCTRRTNLSGDCPRQESVDSLRLVLSAASFHTRRVCGEGARKHSYGSARPPPLRVGFVWVRQRRVLAEVPTVSWTDQMELIEIEPGPSDAARPRFGQCLAEEDDVLDIGQDIHGPSEDERVFYRQLNALRWLTRLTVGLEEGPTAEPPEAQHTGRRTLIHPLNGDGLRSPETPLSLS